MTFNDKYSIEYIPIDNYNMIKTIIYYNSTNSTIMIKKCEGEIDLSNFNEEQRICIYEYLNILSRKNLGVVDKREFYNILKTCRKENIYIQYKFFEDYNGIVMQLIIKKRLLLCFKSTMINTYINFYNNNIHI
jgi:hypothetical protein